MTPGELTRLFRSKGFGQTSFGAAWNVLYEIALERHDSETLYCLRAIRNSAVDGTGDAIIRDCNCLRARIIQLFLTDPQLGAELKPLFTAAQTPILHLEVLPHSMVMLYVVTHSVIPVVAAEAVHKDWMSPVEAQAMARHLHAMLDAIFCALSPDWVYCDLPEFVRYLRGEFGAPNS
jgi:hypothetical protein